MTTERDWRLSVEMLEARKAWLAKYPTLETWPNSIPVRAFDAGYKAALEDHADCHPTDDVDACVEAVKAASRE